MKLHGTREGLYHWCGHTHMCIDVKGGLRLWNKKKNPEIYYELAKADFEGKKVIPMGECDNFSFEDGCQGHTTYAIFYDWKWEEGNG